MKKRNEIIKIFGASMVMMLLFAVLPTQITADEIKPEENGMIIVSTYFEFDIPEVDGHANVSISIYGPADEVYQILEDAIIQSQESIRAAVIPEYDGGTVCNGGDGNKGNVTITICAEVSVGYDNTYIKVSVCVTGPPDEVYELLQEAIEKAIEAAKKAYDKAKEKLKPNKKTPWPRIPTGSMPAPWWFLI